MPALEEEEEHEVRLGDTAPLSFLLSVAQNVSTYCAVKRVQANGEEIKTIFSNLN